LVDEVLDASSILLLRGLWLGWLLLLVGLLRLLDVRLGLLLLDGV